MSEPVTLAPAAVEAVARRVVALLADELGAIRIGDGDRPRLRFDAERALTAWRDREPEPEPGRSPARRDAVRTAPRHRSCPSEDERPHDR